MTIKLPARNYLTFPELMERWACTEADIFHIIADKKLIPSFFFKGEDADPMIWDWYETDGEETYSLDIDNASDLMTPIHGFRYLVYPHQNSAFDLKFDKISTMPQRETLGERFDRLCTDEISFSRLMQYGVVMMSEVVTFENSFSGERQEVEKPLSKRERKSYLNIIGAMLELLQSPRPGRVDDAAIITELVENYGEKYGISESNLNRKFPEAKRTLKAD